MDAHGDEHGVGVGGWWPTPWIGLKVTPENAPWAFQKNGQAYRVIASLDALALLLALSAFGPGQDLSHTKMTIQVPAFTDNRGNGYVINKLMTTRFPLCATVMELAAQAEQRKVRTEADWTPRDRNQEADDLSNLLTTNFAPGKEVREELEDQKWLVLPELLQSGQQIQEKMELEMEQRKAGRAGLQAENEEDSR